VNYAKREITFCPKTTEMGVLIIRSDITEFKFLKCYSFLKTTLKCSYITHWTIFLH